MKEQLKNPCGNSFREMSMEELGELYGADAEPCATSTVSPAVVKSLATVTKSSKVCLGAISGAISGIVSNNKDCLG